MSISPNQIVEFDTPKALLADPASQFSAMLEAAEHNKGQLDWSRKVYDLIYKELEMMAKASSRLLGSPSLAIVSHLK